MALFSICVRRFLLPLLPDKIHKRKHHILADRGVPGPYVLMKKSLSVKKQPLALVGSRAALLLAEPMLEISVRMSHLKVCLKTIG